MENQITYTEEYITAQVLKYSDMVLRLALAYVRNLADAQDICQDVFISLFKQTAAFKDQEHERAWLIRVTINRCKDVLRSPWRKRVAALEKANLPISNEGNLEIVEAVLGLPVKYRAVIHLYYFENYSTAEIAVILQRNESTVRTQLKRARELLKAVIGGMSDE